MTQDQPLPQRPLRASHGRVVAPGQSEPAWRCARRYRPAPWPSALSGWLLSRGSLTADLRELSNDHFRVQVLRQRLARPDRSERRCLGLAPGRWVLVREVILWGCDEPWVFARSLLPLSSLTGPLRRLRQLDARPLGAFLFRQPDLEREPLEVAALPPDSRYVPAAWQGDAYLWGRRSVFRLAKRPLLVSEVFLPDFVRRLNL